MAEEVGIIINEENVNVACMIRRDDNNNYINYFLTTDKNEGEPTIMESEKYEELIWCDLNNIPENTIVAEKKLYIII